MKIKQVKLYRRDLQALIDGEREKALSADNEAQAYCHVLIDDELKETLTNMGHPTTACVAHHRRELGHPASETRWRQYRETRKGNRENK